MAIVFAQPEPMAPNISRDYGAAEQFTRSMPALVQQQNILANIQENQARLQAAGVQGAFERMNRQQLQAAQLGHESAMQSARLSAQANLASAQMAHGTDMQEQHARLQAQLADQQLTRGEEMRLQRMREAIGYINNAVQNNQMTPEEGNEAVMQIRTGIDPLARRQAQAQVMHVQNANRLQEQQYAHNDRLNNERDRFMTSRAQDLIETVTDEATGVEHSFRRNPDGTVTPMGPGQGYGTGGRTGGGTGSGAGGGGGRDTNLRDMTALSEQAERNAAREAPVDPATGRRRSPTADEVVREEQRLLALARIEERVPDRNTLRQQVWREVREMFPNATTAERQRITDRLTDQRMAENLAAVITHAREALTRSVREQMAGMIFPTGGTEPAIANRVERQLMSYFGTRYTPPGQQGQQQQGGERPATVAFDFANPTPEQRSTVAGLTGLRLQIASAPGLNEQQRQQYGAMVNEMQQMLTEYGSNRQAWQQWQRDAYDRRRTALSNIVDQASTPELTTGQHIYRGGGIIWRGIRNLVGANR